MSEPNQTQPSPDEREPVPVDSSDMDNDKDLDALMELADAYAEGSANWAMNLADDELLTAQDVAREALRSRLSALLRVEMAAELALRESDTDWHGKMRNGLKSWKICTGCKAHGSLVPSDQPDPRVHTERCWVSNLSAALQESRDAK